MYIVGTSGHIDHGKTSLIRALTGTDCDRLPEEKAREMTIDLGFARIEDPSFGSVRIIDVPGHERFIRNMVAGAWGIDLALLVVAVDDGWMPQTEDHFRVLQIMGTERIIVVMNKIDLADEEMAEMVREETIERLESTRYHDCDIVEVSSKSGRGIDDLRDIIVANLRKLSKASDSEKPYIYIDRVFSPRGVGTVVTGTLKNGVFHENETVTVLPSDKQVKIKKIESHYQEIHEGVPSQRTALNISGISSDELDRGHLICRDNFFTRTGDIIARLNILEKNRKIKNNSYIEVLSGTSSAKGKMILLEESDGESDSLIVRIRFDNPVNVYPGQSFVIANPGGYRVIGGGTVLIPDFIPSKHRKRVKQELPELKGLSSGEIIYFNVAVKGWMERAQIHRMLPGTKKSVDRMIEEIVKTGLAVQEEEFVLSVRFFDEGMAGVRKAIESGVGLNLREISDMAALNSDIAKIMIKKVVEEDSVIEKDGRYFSGDTVTEENLPQSKRSLLKLLLELGGEGMEIEKLKDDIQKKDVKELIKLDFLISLDGNIIYHRDVYEQMKGIIISLFDEKDKITVPEAKDSVGLSRKYILPLLNRIERDGILKRIGDFRVKA